MFVSRPLLGSSGWFMSGFGGVVLRFVLGTNRAAALLGGGHGRVVFLGRGGP